MKVKVIMTGSSGNCSLISYKNTNILIDAGFSTKKKMDEIIEKQLNDIKIDAILITHEHTDHFNPWTGRFAMQYNIPIYLSLLYTFLPINSSFSGTLNLNSSLFM